MDVLSAGLDLLLKRDAKRKGLVESPRPAPPEEAHNRLAARDRLGDRLMDRFCRDPRQGEVGGTTTPRAPAEGPVPSSLWP